MNSTSQYYRNLINFSNFYSSILKYNNGTVGPQWIWYDLSYQNHQPEKIGTILITTGCSMHYKIIQQNVISLSIGIDLNFIWPKLCNATLTNVQVSHLIFMSRLNKMTTHQKLRSLLFFFNFNWSFGFYFLNPLVPYSIYELPSLITNDLGLGEKRARTTISIGSNKRIVEIERVMHIPPSDGVHQK